MESDAKRTVRLNVRALLEQKCGPLPPGQSGVSRQRDLGVKQGSAQRTLMDEQDISLKTVDDCARAFGVRAYELLMPDFATRRLGQESATGLGTAIESRLRGLDDAQLISVRAGIAGILQAIGQPVTETDARQASRPERRESERTSGASARIRVLAQRLEGITDVALRDRVYVLVEALIDRETAVSASETRPDRESRRAQTPVR